MPRQPVTLPPSVLPLATESGRSLRWRLHQGLKTAILSGQLAPGTRLPSSRALAASLDISRSTVVEAFDQLTAEGFVARKAGSGTFVSAQLDALRATRQRLRRRRDRAGQPPRRQGRPLRSTVETTADPHAGRLAAFTPCEPDVTVFPHQLWARILARHTRAAGLHYEP